MEEQLKNVHIVVAAGSGSRYGGNLPKQFCLLDQRPLLMTTLERLHRHTPDWELIVVLSPDMTDLWKSMCTEHDFSLPHRIVAADGSTKAVDRKLYRSVQTPQIFPAAKLAEAYRRELRPEFTDDASVMEAAGFCNLRLTDGDPHNIKVTNPGDMAVAEIYLSLTD